MYKVITTAKRSGYGTISREHAFFVLPDPSQLRLAVEEAIVEWQTIHGATDVKPVVDVTVRRDF